MDGWFSHRCEECCHERLHTFSSVDSAISQLVTDAGGTDSNIASSFGLPVEKKCAWTKSIIFLEVGIYDMKRI